MGNLQAKIQYRFKSPDGLHTPWEDFPLRVSGDIGWLPSRMVAGRGEIEVRIHRDLKDTVLRDYDGDKITVMDGPFTARESGGRTYAQYVVRYDGIEGANWYTMETEENLLTKEVWS